MIREGKDHGFCKVSEVSILLRSVSISDLGKILNFIGETLGIDYETTETPTEDGKVSLEICGSRTEEGKADE